MWKRGVIGCVCLVGGAMLMQAVGQEEGLGERIGEKIDRGLNQLGKEVREQWTDIRRSVERMGTQGRVYSRVHWDKDLESAEIAIDLQSKDTVVLKGSVPNAAAKKKAVQLARDTVGVTQVIDELAIAPAR